jgi:hypothetical protein
MTTPRPGFTKSGNIFTPPRFARIRIGIHPRELDHCVSGRAPIASQVDTLLGPLDQLADHSGVSCDDVNT